MLRLLGLPTWQRRDGEVVLLAPQRRHQLLALLGYQAQWMSRDALAALFWPERPERAARANLRKVIHELRALHLEGLEEGPLGLRWLVASDVAVFQQAWDEGDWPRAAAAGAGVLMQGLDDTLGGTAFGDWLRGERQRWHARWRQAVLQAAACSEPSAALALAEQLLGCDAVDEEAMALALRAAAALQRPELAQAAWSRYVERLRDDLGSAPPQALLALAQGEASAQLTPLSPLVGRERELQELGALLAEGRLVTVLGAGGVGKTRLARHGAQSLASRFAQGAVFVALEDAHTPDELPARMASALGVAVVAGGNIWQALTRALATRSLLLVLDGFEAVIDAGPALLRLLASAPGLRILVTSRERLAVDGEWLLPLSGLAVPERGATDQAVQRALAVVLFATRARAVNPAFDLTVALGPVAEICRRLDGLPLALELAASWVRLLPPAEIADELKRGIDLLDQGGDVDLHAVFDRSWGLLSTTERDAQAALAVFHGGFTRDAAQQVAGVELRTLAALVDKSMLTVRPGGRFDMHALVLAQARRKLAAHADAASLQQAHSRRFLALAAQPGADLAAEHDNLLAAWQTAVVRRDAAALEAVLFRMPWVSLVHGQIGQAVKLLQEAVQAFDADAPTGAQLQALQAWLLLWQGQRERACALAESALQKLAGKPQVAGRVMALRTLGHAARLRGQHALAAQYLTQGMQHAREASLKAIEALMQDGLAMALNMLGRHDEARAAIEAAIRLNGESGDATQGLYNLYNLSQSHSLAGEPAQALPWAGQALVLARRIGFAYFLPHVHVELALIYLGLRQFEEARRELDAARRLALDHQDLAVLAAVHEATARLALDEGDTARARGEIATAARLCLEHDNVMTSAALVLTATRLPGPDMPAGHWLDALMVLAEVQQPVRRLAAAARGLQGPEGIASSPPPGLRELVAQVIVATGRA